jgi:hypothetical protein
MGTFRLGTVLLGASMLALAPASTSSLTAQSAPASSGDSIFAFTKLHRIYISVSAAEWAVLQTSSPRNGGGQGGTDYKQADGRLVHVGSGFGGFFPWAHADMRVDGAEFKGVGLRYKGNLSFTTSSAAAPLFANFKLKIDTYGAKGAWDDEKTFNFHAGVVDTSKMREAIAFAVFRAAGVPAPRTTYAELFFTVPGVYQDTSAGLFTIIEDVNKRFLTRVLPPGTGLLMKPEGLRGGVHGTSDTWASFTPTLRPDREATAHEQQRVMEFAHLISQTDVALFRAKIGSYLDTDEFLRFIAVNALIVNMDSYLTGGHNFYLYLDPKDDKFRFIPWDQDLSMGSRGFGGTALDVMQPSRGDNALIYWLLDDPAVAARYRTIVKEIVAKIFNATDLLKMVDDLDKVGTGRGASPRAFLESRAAYAQQLVASWGK